MLNLFKFFPLLLVCLISSPISLLADNWQANLNDEGLPSHLVAVDKNRQTFLFFERKSPLKLKYSFPCVTGQLAGDKYEINDLKTPEGIYFVEYKIASGLDFKEYGGIAYTLNYPNPVDKLRGKTGHGIWIHSKGFGLVPTRGCVAIGLKDIDIVGPSLTPGTPVILAEHMNEQNDLTANNQTAKQLRKLMQDWSNAWASRSTKLFDYYDQDAYSKATQPFIAFKQNKERLFKMLSFIKIYNRDIHVLEGPGYWVTWAEQFYTASNLSTEGIRRLYWQQGKDKKFRIVGMEWTPRDLGMRVDFQNGRLVASTNIPVISDASSEAPLPPRIDMPEKATENSNELKTPTPSKELAFSDPLVPGKSPNTIPAEINWDTNKKQTDDNKENQSKVEEEVKPKSNTDTQKNQVTNEPKQPETKVNTQDITISPAPLSLTSEVKSEIDNLLKDWIKDFNAKSEDISKFYDQEQFNRVKGLPKISSLNTTLNNLKRRFALPWFKLITHDATFELQNDIVITRQPQLIITPDNSEQGEQTFWWKRDKDNKFKIIQSQFRYAELGLMIDYLEDVSSEVSNTIEKWRNAWEKADLDTYISFYLDNAIQQGRYGAKNIQRQKEDLWKKVQPKSVQLTGLRLAIDRKGLRADMNQIYSDTNGLTDKGVKTLFLRFDGTKWLIQREDWVALPKLPLNTITQ